MSPSPSTPAHQRIVIGRSAAGLPRTYRLVRTQHNWAAQLVAGLRGILS